MVAWSCDNNRMGQSRPGGFGYWLNRALFVQETGNDNPGTGDVGSRISVSTAVYSLK